ncbi:putative pre-16S rRNA nuclease [uncultured Gammaproteobacteria bacterium]
MAIRNLTDLRQALPRGKRLIGLDLGAKTIGLALCDPGLSVASPIGTLKRGKFTADARELARVMAERDAGGLVIGLPVNMNGEEGSAAQSARQFGLNLLERADLFGREPEIVFWDERMSTMAINRLLVDEADLSRKRRAEVVDKMAAAYILQGALDALRYQAARLDEAKAKANQDVDAESEPDL